MAIRPVTPWHLEKINLAAARKRGLTGTNVLVGVLDTGIDPHHDEFKGKQIVFAKFGPSGELDSTAPASDAGGHGTHVSALIAGRTCGVAPHADLAVAAVMTLNRGHVGTLTQILAGVNWLLTTRFQPNESPGVDVINASLGVTPYDPFLYAVLEAAHRSFGTLIIGAVGNKGGAPGHHLSPANYDIACAVGATDVNDRIAPFSDWGRVAEHAGVLKPDLCAPGVALRSALLGNAYGTLSGTSSAAPLVAGAAALLIQADARLSFDAAALKRELMKLVVPIVDGQRGVPVHGRRGGAGRLDLTGIPVCGLSGLIDRP